jgi:hypothetical protein
MQRVRFRLDRGSWAAKRCSGLRERMGCLDLFSGRLKPAKGGHIRGGHKETRRDGRKSFFMTSRSFTA